MLDPTVDFLRSIHAGSMSVIFSLPTYRDYAAFHARMGGGGDVLSVA
jgi:hypothetical protein